MPVILPVNILFSSLLLKSSLIFNSSNISPPLKKAFTFLVNVFLYKFINYYFIDKIFVLKIKFYHIS